MLFTGYEHVGHVIKGFTVLPYNVIEAQIQFIVCQVLMININTLTNKDISKLVVWKIQI